MTITDEQIQRVQRLEMELRRLALVGPAVLARRAKDADALRAVLAERVAMLRSLGCDEHGVSIEGAYEGTRQDWIDRCHAAEAGLELAEYLKDGETPVECLARNRADIDALLTLLRQEKEKVKALTRQLHEMYDAAIPKWREQGYDHQVICGNALCHREDAELIDTLDSEQDFGPQIRERLKAKDARLAVLEEALRGRLRKLDAAIAAIKYDGQRCYMDPRDLFAERASVHDLLAGQEPPRG
jgi:hypothetical protein